MALEGSKSPNIKYSSASAKEHFAAIIHREINS
jgi:hypothetical protein